MTDQVRTRPRDRRASILAAARARFHRHGYTGTSLEDIAGDLGITAPALYRHFRGKDALYTAALESNLVHLEECVADDLVRRRGGPSARPRGGRASHHRPAVEPRPEAPAHRSRRVHPAASGRDRRHARRPVRQGSAAGDRAPARPRRARGPLQHRLLRDHLGAGEPGRAARTSPHRGGRLPARPSARRHRGLERGGGVAAVDDPPVGAARRGRSAHRPPRRLPGGHHRGDRRDGRDESQHRLRATSAARRTSSSP